MLTYEKFILENKSDDLSLMEELLVLCSKQKVSKEDINRFEYLLENGVYLKFQYHQPLFRLIENENIELLKVFVKKNSPVNTCINLESNYPLQYAVRLSTLNTIELLIDNGYNCGDDSDLLPLLTSIVYDKKDIFDYLLDNGISIISYSIYRRCVINENLKYLELLLQRHDNNLYEYNDMILDLCVRLNKPTPLKLFFKYGLVVYDTFDIKTIIGQSTELIELILSNCKNKQIKDFISKNELSQTEIRLFKKYVVDYDDKKLIYEKKNK